MANQDLISLSRRKKLNSDQTRYEVHADTKQTASCYGTTEDGAQFCAVPQDGQPTSCGCSSIINQTALPENNTKLLEHVHVQPQSKLTASRNSRMQEIRGGLMFVIACITSPCCTPLIVPVVLALLAGTPAAIWMSANLGLVFGALTLVSIVSFVMGLRWMNKRNKSQPVIRVSNIPRISRLIGEKAHVE